jgi:hypothetical protein
MAGPLPGVVDPCATYRSLLDAKSQYSWLPRRPQFVGPVVTMVQRADSGLVPGAEEGEGAGFGTTA